MVKICLWNYNLIFGTNEWMTLMCLLSVLISFPSILILIARVRTTNRLWGTFPLTMIGEEKVPHLAPWQQAMALSGLMNYIDTQAILMTLSIYPSPLSFLSLFPALGLAPASSHSSKILSWVHTHPHWVSLRVCVCMCVLFYMGVGLLLNPFTACSEAWFKSI